MTVHQTLARTAIAAILAVAPFHAALADGGTVVVVAPSADGTEFKVKPTDRVTVRVVRLPGGVSVAVVRIEPMPDKPDFNIITPDGASHPFKRTGPDGMTSEVVVVHGTDGKTFYKLVSCFPGGGCASVSYPPGSQLVPDPPQPPGTHFVSPGATPLDTAYVGALLTELGFAAEDGMAAWIAPQGVLTMSNSVSPVSATMIVEHDAPPLPAIASAVDDVPATAAVGPSSSADEVVAIAHESSDDAAAPISDAASLDDASADVAADDAERAAADEVALVQSAPPLVCGFGLLPFSMMTLAALAVRRVTRR